MKHSFLRLLFLSIPLLILTGCFGGDDETPTAPIAEEGSGVAENFAPAKTVQFAIGGNEWKVSFPSGWIEVPSPSPTSGAVVLAHNQTANFVLLQKVGADQISPEVFLDKAKEDFEIFELGEVGTNTWNFTGKGEITQPMRVFLQRTEPIPGTNNYLYASCSYEATTEFRAGCQQVLDGWQSVQSAEISE